MKTAKGNWEGPHSQARPAHHLWWAGQVVEETKKALEKAEMKLMEEDSDLANFWRGYLKAASAHSLRVLNAENKCEQESNLTRSKLAVKPVQWEATRRLKGFKEAM